MASEEQVQVMLIVRRKDRKATNDFPNVRNLNVVAGFMQLILSLYYVDSEFICRYTGVSKFHDDLTEYCVLLNTSN